MIGLTRIIFQLFAALYAGMAVHFFVEISLQHFAHASRDDAEFYARLLGATVALCIFVLQRLFFAAAHKK